MIELKVKMSRPDGTAKTVPDYLLEETPEKFRHCCEVLRAARKYETGVLADDDFVGKRGKLRLGIEKGKKNSGYPDRNIIADYVGKGASSPKSAKPDDAAEFLGRVTRMIWQMVGAAEQGRRFSSYRRGRGVVDARIRRCFRPPSPCLWVSA